ncbi:MAG: hypothetical protein ACR2M5_14715 [Nakamurella sp.]
MSSRIHVGNVFEQLLKINYPGATAHSGYVAIIELAAVRSCTIQPIAPAHIPADRDVEL